MHRATNLTKKELADLEPGELIRYSFGNEASLLLFLQTLDDGTGLFGVIESSAFEKPMLWHSMRREGNCLSYGLDWLLEELHGAETACGLLYAHQQASLILDDDGLVMIFRSGRGRFGYQNALFHSVRNVVVDRIDDQTAAPILNWRVWESPDHFADGTGMLFEMKAVAAA